MVTSRIQRYVSRVSWFLVRRISIRDIKATLLYRHYINFSYDWHPSWPTSHTHDGVRTVIFSVTYMIVILSPEIMYIGKLSPNAKSRFVTAIRTCGWGDWLAIHLIGGTCLWCNWRGLIRRKLRRPVITGPFSIAADQKTPLRSDFRLRYGNQISFARHSGRLSRGKILQNRTDLPLIRPHIRSWSKRKADCRQASWRYEHNAFLACIVSRWRSCLDSYLFRYDIHRYLKVFYKKPLNCFE